MDFSRLDKIMKEMTRRGIPGCELSVSYKGEEVYHRCAGYSDHDGLRPASENDIYWIFSCTKVVTCTAAMQLVESGKIGLDDPVAKYLPEFADIKVKNESTGSVAPAKNIMTVRHLFSMSSGMDYNFGADPIEKAIKEDGATTRSIARAMARVPLGFEPGEDYRYSLSHDVLGAVIEQASGMKLSEYIQKYIFDPLGMKDIGFHPTDGQSKRITAQYRYHNGTNTVEPRETANRYAFSPDYDSGGAGLFSTVTEYMKLVTVLANGGTSEDGYVLLRPETIKMMGENQLSDKGRDTFCKGRFFGYGWGLCGRVHMDPDISFSRSSVGEFGWDGAAGAFTMIDPEKNIAMYFGTHVFGFGYGYNVLHPMLRNLVIEAIEGK